jgi:putative membrane protein
MKISENEKQLVKKAIEKAEGNTSGEILPVILKSSDMYPAAHFRGALLLSAISSFLTYLFIDFDDPIVLIWAQIVGLLVGYLLAFIPAIKRILITQREVDEEVYQKALEVFFEHNVSQTVDRTGILILVSTLEHKIEVLADCGINSKVDENYWNDIVKKLIIDIKNKQFIPGICKAIEDCGKKLEENFPRKENDTNEIKDELIIQ